MYQNLPDVEIYVTEKMADIRRDVEQRNLVYEVERANVHIPGWVADKIHSLSIWMIRTGENLHERLHAPANVSHIHHHSTQSR